MFLTNKILSTLLFLYILSGLFPLSGIAQTKVVQPTVIQTFPPGLYPDRIILTLSADPATTQSVTWRTDSTIQQAKAQIYLEDSSPFLDTLASSIPAITQSLRGNGYATASYHSVTFVNLLPDKLYTYRVGDGKHWSEWFQFRTAPVQKVPFSFIYLGDAQNDIRSKWSRVIRRAFYQQPDARFILHAGDLINRSNNDSEWGEWHFGAGFINGMIPTLPSPGNHEYFRDENKKLTLDPHWQPQFTLPANGPQGLEESVYYIDYQNVRIISLNSQMIVLDQESAEKQAIWLENVLKDNPQQWTVITFHHPIFSTAKGRDNKGFADRFKPLFEKYKVDLLLQGHDHTYSRGRNLAEMKTDPAASSKSTSKNGISKSKNGPVYVVSVAGPKMYKIDAKKWMDVSAENTQLFQLIHIDTNTLKYESYKVNGQLLDSFIIEKKAVGKPSRFIEMHTKAN